MRKVIILCIILLFLPVTLHSADVTFTIPDAYVPRVLAAVCDVYGYDASTDGTPVNFIKTQIKRFLLETTLAYEFEQAKSAIVPEPITMEE